VRPKIIFVTQSRVKDFIDSAMCFQKMMSTTFNELYTQSGLSPENIDLNLESHFGV
jgi:hypothetical protein